MASTWTLWSVTSLVLFFILMTGFGCSLHFDKFKQHIKKPKGIIIGFLSQYLLMPFICWFLTEISGLDDHLQVALILIGCCPGGAISNIICYIFRMDIELSIAMTTCSSTAAIVMMPLNTYLYVEVVSDVEFEFDWSGLVISCLVVVFGTLFGLIINVNFYQYSIRFERFGMIAAISIGIGTLLNNMQSDVPLWNYNPAYIYVIIFAPIVIGYCFGFTLTRCLKLDKASTIAVSNETGLQNTVLAIAIITLTYKFGC